MGQWDSYESDYNEDYLIDFELIQDFREGRPL